MNHPRSDEDRLDIPASWLAHLLPRRGGHPAPQIELDPGAAESVAKRTANRRGEVEAALASRANEAYADDGFAHLSGDARPLGAAAVMHLISTGKYGGINPQPRQSHLDAWVAEHGLGFAAAAMVESLSIEVTQGGGRSGIAGMAVGEMSHPHYGWAWSEAKPAIARLRALLARAADEEYRAAVAAVAPHRTGPARVVASALLMPAERPWVEEACRERRRSHTGHDWVTLAFVGALGDLAILGHEILAEPYGADERSLVSVLDGLGADALPFLTARLDSNGDLTAADRGAVFKAIGSLPSDEAVGYLLDRLSTPGALATALETARRFPARALRRIASRAKGADAVLRPKLTGIAKTVTGHTPTAVALLDENARAAVEALLDDSSHVRGAPAEALPALLVTPPWTVKRRKAKAVTVDGLEPAIADRIVWAEGERETWCPDGPPVWHREHWRDEIRRAERTSKFQDATRFFSEAPIDDATRLLDRWDGTSPYPIEDEIKRILARFELRVADRLTALLKKNPAFGAALLPIVTRQAARLAADWLWRLKSVRPIARQWLDRHAEAAVHFLVLDAVGPDKKARTAASAALRHLITASGPDAVLAIAKHYGPEAEAAVTALAEVDPLDPVDVKIPKPPQWAEPAMLPQVLLADRRSALPEESVRHLTTVLAVASPDFPYPGIDVVAETCDRDSLAQFSWALFDLWIAAGSPSKDGWALTQLAHFGDDDAVRSLTPMIREWPGRSQHKRAVTGLEVLGAIGTEAALRGIHGIAEKVRFKALKEKATEQIEAIAANLGLTTEQLGDRLVPDFGLDDASTLVLDYGPRQFTVGFDERLKPFVTDANGKPRKSLPKPGAKDDQETAQTAYRRFAQLKKDLRSVAREQVARFERAMISARTWTAPEFTEYFVEHPLVWHLARRLVWTADTGEGPRGFRIAEDRGFTDVDDEEFGLPDDAVVRLAHPAHLGEDLSAWAEILADYEILQPFEQLSRPVMAFTDEELATGRLARFEGASIESVRVLGMTHWGWERAEPEDGGCEPGVHYRLPGGGFVLVDLEPGLYAGDVSAFPEQTVRAVRLAADRYHWSPPGRESRPHPVDIDPVTASEVLGALARITRTE